MSAGLHIILVTPSLVNIVSGTLTLGAIVHKRIAMLLVTRRGFPRLLDLEFDFVAVLAARANIVVVVERNHTIVHFRVSKKPCLN
jgi:hypothetical protein